MLKIAKAERFVLDVPYTPRCEEWNALMVRQWRIVEIIKVTLADGTVGWGESLPHYTWAHATDTTLTAVVGQNPLSLIADDSLGAGLQIALLDAAGKALKLPVWALVGGPLLREETPLAWWNTEMNPEALAEEAKDAVAAGYTFHKIKARPFLDTFAQVEAISAATPAHFRLDMDFNDMLLHPGIAAPILQELDQYEKVALYEGPIPQRDLEGYRKLREKIVKPIATHADVPPLPIALREENCDGFVLSECGLSNARRVNGLCAAFEKPYWLQGVGSGLMTAYLAHLGAVLSHARWPTVTCMNNYADDLLVEPLTIKDGFVQVPMAPGLGVEFDESVLEKYHKEPPYHLPERRHIITISWPSGRRVHYAYLVNRLGNHAQVPFSHAANAYHLDTNRQCWEDFLLGNQPIEPRGVRLSVWKEDGTDDWQTLYNRCLRGPVRGD